MIDIVNESGITIKYSKNKLVSWIELVAKKEHVDIGALEIILFDNKEITAYNTRFLQHPYPTDVITFGECRKSKIYGTVLVGIEIVKENAIEHNVSILKEFYRVIIHGVLHLIGYNDNNEYEKMAMRTKEDIYLEDILKQ